MASNIQRGTRGLSAGDWIRLQRLRGSRGFNNNNPNKTIDPDYPKDKDITNSSIRSEPESGRRVYTEFGTSKIRRPASGYTDYIAFQTADYVVETTVGTCGDGRYASSGVERSLTIKMLCTCSISSAIKHNGPCAKCTK